MAVPERKCCACSLYAPEKGLLSPLGWRLERNVVSDDEIRYQWWCSKCWKERRASLTDILNWWEEGMKK